MRFDKSGGAVDSPSNAKDTLGASRLYHVSQYHFCFSPSSSSSFTHFPISPYTLLLLSHLLFLFLNFCSSIIGRGESGFLTLVLTLRKPCGQYFFFFLMGRRGSCPAEQSSHFTLYVRSETARREGEVTKLEDILKGSLQSNDLPVLERPYNLSNIPIVALSLSDDPT
jgi:hypothetical protein